MSAEFVPNILSKVQRFTFFGISPFSRPPLEWAFCFVTLLFCFSSFFIYLYMYTFHEQKAQERVQIHDSHRIIVCVRLFKFLKEYNIRNILV